MALKGIKFSKEHIRKIKLARAKQIIPSGKDSWNFGRKASKETKLKMSNSRKGKKFTRQHIKNMIKNHRGMLGLKHSKETIEKMKNYHPKDKTKKKTSKSIKEYLKTHKHNRLGTTHSIETKQKISKSISGKNNPFYGKKHTLASLKKMRISRLNQIFPKKDSAPEKLLQKELNARNILFEKHISLIGQPDIFIKPNICIFVDGEYVHGDKRRYKETDLLMGGKIAKDKWKYDKNISRKLRNKGYKVLRFWERDIYKNINTIGNKIETIIMENDKDATKKNI